MKNVLIVVPVFNEAASLEHNLRCILAAAAQGCEQIAFNLLAVDDGSVDDTHLALARFCEAEPRARVLRFTRNFGKESAIAAGLMDMTADTDAVVLIDSDLQHPPELCVAGMHGNQHAGIKAIELMQMMLEVEPITNPEFEFNGRFVGMVGNVKASKKDVRFLVKDINRQWKYQNLDRIFHTPEKDLDPEDQELKELWVAVNMEIQAYQPELLVFLDLHTTSAYGGIYSITPEDPESIQVAQAITAPVVRGLLEGVSGTTLHFFNTKNLGVKTIYICFESGQHAEALSINRATQPLFRA